VKSFLLGLVLSVAGGLALVGLLWLVLELCCAR
jgi:hypothetical protein